jgi:hypothetical protein
VWSEFKVLSVLDWEWEGSRRGWCDSSAGLAASLSVFDCRSTFFSLGDDLPLLYGGGGDVCALSVELLLVIDLVRTIL